MSSFSSLYFSSLIGENTAGGEQKPFQPKNSVIETEWVTGHLLCLLYQKHPLGQSQQTQCVCKCVHTRVCVCVCVCTPTHYTD